MKTINCKGKLIDLSKPKVMGILNLTPDSFYDGGKLTSETEILKQAETMLSEGATFIDLGGYSSRPGADVVLEEEEMKRVLPAVRMLLKEFPDVLLSIDTFRSNIARSTVGEGAALINDISGGNLDSEMFSTIAELQVPYILMHMKGTPQTMTSKTQYKDLLKEVLYYFSEKISMARALGIKDLIADPGFGFAKTREQNFELLSDLQLLKHLDLPILVGISRKSMIYKTLNTSPSQALNGTTALHSVILYKGASILRVHDVKEAIECVTLCQNLK